MSVLTGTSASLCPRFGHQSPFHTPAPSGRILHVMYVPLQHCVSVCCPHGNAAKPRSTPEAARREPPAHSPSRGKSGPGSLRPRDRPVRRTRLATGDQLFGGDVDQGPPGRWMLLPEDLARAGVREVVGLGNGLRDEIPAQRRQTLRQILVLGRRAFNALVGYTDQVR
jgi:hypothetical protein